VTKTRGRLVQDAPARFSLAVHSRGGDVPEDGPVVINGVDTIDVSATQQGFLSVNHNTFAEASELVKDIRKLFLSGIRPPARRTPDLETVPLGSDVYWRFRTGAQ
ncbi:MAG: hypothetical protein AAFZ01_12560, partial [Pseudomonadota bacterium]